MDEVGFGFTTRAKNVTQLLTGEVGEAHRILKAAADATGDEILSDFEETFTASCLQQIARMGMRWELSEKRDEVIKGIKRKLQKEGLY